MDTYRVKLLEGDDILLEKFFIDLDKYTIIEKDNGNKILRKKINYINITDIKEMKKYDFTKSSVIECIIDSKNFTKLNYRSILMYVYGQINDGTKIIKNTTIPIKTIKKEDEGYIYLSDIGISFQGQNGIKSLTETIIQCIENKIELLMKIKLIDDTSLYLSF
jgi:hypothetical protein